MSWQSQYINQLPDWSYAGYRAGADIPAAPAPTVTVQCDRTGATDVTLAIQQAIVDVAKRGGGTVYLPAGTYRISPQSKALWPQSAKHFQSEGTNVYSLWIPASGVVLRGDGPETRLYNAD